MDIERLLAEMTLDEKLGQLLQVHTRWHLQTRASLTGPEKQLGISNDAIDSCGSVLNFMGADEMLTLQKQFVEKKQGRIPLLFMQNVVNGHKTVYPIPLAMGATFNPDLLEECCDMAAKEASASGVHVTFAPMLDLVRDARWGRVMESTGEDPYLNSVMARSFVRGFQGSYKKKHNLATCVKHFAAYGGAEAGRDYNTVDISDHNLRQYYLPAYKAAIEEGADMVMTSFNTLNGVPASGSSYLLNDILREEYGFDGILISDYDAIGELIDHGFCENEKEAARVGITCNVDIEMMSACYVKYAKELLDEGKISMEQIDKMVLRVLKLKDKLGLFENPCSAASREMEKKLFCCRKHRDIARRAAEESLVLLKNENGILPLRKTEKIALIGPFGDTGETIGHWCCLGVPEDTVTLFAGMKKHTYTRNIYRDDACSFLMDDIDESGFRTAIAKMKKADKVVLAIGEHQMYSGEGKSRAHIVLPRLHIRLAEEAKKLGKPTVAVVYTGRPLELEPLSALCDSILLVWQPGTEGGNAIANVLYGKVNPSGKLTMSFPYTVGQLPIYYNHFSTGRPKAKGDAIPEHPDKMPCTSMYGDVKNSPLYCFGYGLSYTQFCLEDVAISASELTVNGKITVTAKLKNTGAVAGAEVVQLYIRDNYASIVRPVKELKGFQKVYLDAGEKKEISFDINEEMLRFYTASGEYTSEKGDFTAMIGTDSERVQAFSFSLV